MWNTVFLAFSSLNSYFKEHHYCYCKEKIAIEGADCKNFEKPTEKHKYKPQGSKIPKKKSRGLGKKTKKQKNQKKQKNHKKTIFWNSCSRPPTNPDLWKIVLFGFFP